MTFANCLLAGAKCGLRISGKSNWIFPSFPALAVGWEMNEKIAAAPTQTHSPDKMNFFLLSSIDSFHFHSACFSILLCIRLSKTFPFYEMLSLSPTFKRKMLGKCWIERDATLNLHYFQENKKTHTKSSFLYFFRKNCPESCIYKGRNLRGMRN